MNKIRLDNNRYKNPFLFNDINISYKYLIANRYQMLILESKDDGGMI